MKLAQLAATAFTLLLCATPTHAQQAGPTIGAGGLQTTGVPGSPNATTTVDGRYLPQPPQPFAGQIGLNAAQSKGAWPATVVPPE